MSLKLFATLLGLAALSLFLLSACGGDGSSDDGSSSASPGATDADASPDSNGSDGSDGSDGSNGEDEATPPPPVPPTIVPPAAEDCEVSGLTSMLEFGGEDRQYDAGEPVEMTATFRNCSEETVRLFYATGQRYEFLAKDEDGNEIWRWSNGQNFANESGEETVETGENLVYTETWDQTDDDGDQVDPGVYRLFGFSTGCASQEAAEDGCAFGTGLDIEVVEEVAE